MFNKSLYLLAFFRINFVRLPYISGDLVERGVVAIIGDR
jgi:hypothetical protein